MAIALKHWERYRVEPAAEVRSHRFSTDEVELCDDKKEARKELRSYRTKIDELAATLAVEHRRSLLVVLQGMDAAGKDGAVKKVFTGVNPQNCKVVSFKSPDREELDHDYLWRVHRALPAMGELGVFNRSHYEDVVAREARGDIRRGEAHRRLRQIADAERTWTENGIAIRKIFLHISRTEQSKRFQARLDTPEKHWKVAESDFADRRLWPRFQSIYAQALVRTSTAEAPWYIVPADHKWYRDIAVAGIVLGALQAMNPKIPVCKLDPEKFQL